MSYPKINILLVEDSEDDIFFMENAFQEFGNKKLHVVTDGNYALDFLYKRGEYTNAVRPDIILLDLNLPKKNGHELLKILKNDEELKQIPVIVLSSSEDSKDINKSYELNANCYIVKPIGTEEALKIVGFIDNFWKNLPEWPRPLL